MAITALTTEHPAMQKITPFRWIDRKTEEAANSYVYRTEKIDMSLLEQACDHA